MGYKMNGVLCSVLQMFWMVLVLIKLDCLIDCGEFLTKIRGSMVVNNICRFFSRQKKKVVVIQSWIEIMPFKFPFPSLSEVIIFFNTLNWGKRPSAI